MVDSSVSEPWVLGLAASHNGAACLLQGERIVGAIQEERLTRVKRAPLVPSRPFRSLHYLLDAAGIEASAIDAVVLCPLHSPDAAHNDLDRHPELCKTPRYVIPHHYGHAMGAYAQSGFESAMVCVIDAMGSRFADLPRGEQEAVVGLQEEHKGPTIPGCEARELVSFYAAEGGALRPLEKHLGGHDVFDPQGDFRPHMMGFVGLGVMYMSVAQQIFGHWGDSGKLMGLAPFGSANIPRETFWGLEDELFFFSKELHTRIRHDERWPNHERFYADLAASTQRALEEGLEHLWMRLKRHPFSRKLCYAGGVALNSVANEELIRKAHFDEVFIMPAAADCGTAIGAAYHGFLELGGHLRGRAHTHDFWGKDYGVGTPSEETLQAVAKRLCEGDVIAWFQGGSEFGPRALGHRSILADPRRPEARERLNSVVKGREGFRPFAPVVLAEHAARWFEFGSEKRESPFMLRVVPVRKERRSQVPSITHVDGTSRPQTLKREQEATLFRLLEIFNERSAVPMLLNTSFNVMGEPIVETPQEALELARSRDIDYLVLGEQLILTKCD